MKTAAAIPLKKSRKEKQCFLKGILLSCFFNCLCCSKDCCVLPKRCCCPVPLYRCHCNVHFGGSGINHCRKPCPWVFFCVVDISFLSCLSPLFILFARVSFFIKESVWNFSAKKEHKMFKLCLCHVHILFKIVEYTNYNRENKESKKQFRYNRRNEICIIQMKIKEKTITT